MFNLGFGPISRFPISALSLSRVFVDTVGETLVLIDAAAGIVPEPAFYSAPFVDGLSLSESIATQITAQSGQVDSALLADSTGSILVASGAVDDPLGFADSVSCVLVTTCSVSELVGVSDELPSESGIVVSIADCVALSDAASAILEAIGTAADSVEMGDSAGDNGKAVSSGLCIKLRVDSVDVFSDERYMAVKT